MSDLRNKVEALLFAVGKHIDIEEICRITKAESKSEVSHALEEIQNDYDGRESPIMVVSEGNAWKLTVREKYLGMVKNLVAETELSKTILESLAVIAWKNPVKQSEVIKIRTNKAYDHIHELEDLGFIARTKHGRTMLIKLTDKFYNYFELTGDADIREVFEKVGVDEAMQKKVDEYSNGKLGKLKIYEESEKEKEDLEKMQENNKDKLGDLEIVDESENDEAGEKSDGTKEPSEEHTHRRNEAENINQSDQQADIIANEDTTNSQDDDKKNPYTPDTEKETPQQDLSTDKDVIDPDEENTSNIQDGSAKESGELESLFDKANKEAESLEKKKSKN